MEAPRNIINITDLSTEEIDELIDVAQDIMANPADYQDICHGKQLATLFFEPSTRTRLSFESAMLSLGGATLGFSEAQSSSASKGESVSDTIRVVGNYVDIIAMRHPKEGAPIAAAMKTIVPIINAGDGGHFHPTQTLTDLLTIKRQKGTLEGLTIGLCGDLKFGRTVHSLVAAMLRYKGVKFVLISPEELKMPFLFCGTDEETDSELLSEYGFHEVSTDYSWIEGLLVNYREIKAPPKAYEVGTLDQAPMESVQRFVLESDYDRLLQIPDGYLESDRFSDASLICLDRNSVVGVILLEETDDSIRVPYIHTKDNMALLYALYILRKVLYSDYSSKARLQFLMHDGIGREAISALINPGVEKKIHVFRYE